MAEPKLTYGIYFDMEDGLQKAQQDWNKVQQQLQRTIDSKSVEVKIEGLKDVSGVNNSIASITSKLKELSTAWNKMSESVKFDEGGNLSADAQKLVNDFSQLTAQLQTSGKTLEQLSAEARKSVEQELKDIEKRNIANEKAAQKEIELNQRRYKSQVEYNQQVKALEGQKAQDYDQLKFKYSNQEYEQNIKSLEVQQQINQSKREQAQIADRAFDRYKTELRLQEQIQANEANRAKQASYNASRSQGLERVRILKAEENSISAINAKLAIQRQRLNEVDMGSNKFQKIAAEVKRLSMELEKANARVKLFTTTQVQSTTQATTAIKKQTEALGEQAGYLQRFGLRMVMYSAIFGSVNFLRSIRDTTAQFQLQEVALGGIIQDGQKAAQIFSQIKEAAQKSPFQVLDMVTYTKQLAAYRIETDKLFGTMNMLADISSGLGVGMDRLILVFGQVKAAGKLLGSEVRQFREAGLGIVEMLADRYSKLEGTMVSVAEVTKRISDGMVSFKDVQAVLEGLTSAGGMFYQMQAKQANTLFGELSNLKDALQIAQSEMGKTLEPMFLASIRSSKAVLQNWESLWAIIKVTGTALLVYKGITMSTAVAENALVLAKAKSIALDTTSARLTPKLITLIIGKNNAIKLSKTMYELLIASQARAAAATNVLSKSFFKLTTFLLTNPYTAIIAAVAALGVAIWATSSNANKLQKELAKIGAEATTNINYLNRNFARLAKEALNAANGSSTQKKALDELNRTYGDILPSQSLTIEGLKAMKGNYEAVAKAIYEKIKAQQYENSVSAIQEEYTGKFASSEEGTRKLLKNLGLDPNEINIAMQQIRQAVDNGLINVTDDVETQAKAIAKIIKDSTGEKIDFNELIGTDIQAVGMKGMIPIWTSYDRLKGSLKDIVADYSSFNKEVDDLNKGFETTPNAIIELEKGFNESTDKYKSIIEELSGIKFETEFDFDVAENEKKIKRYKDFIKEKFETVGFTLSFDEFIKWENIDISKRPKEINAQFEKLYDGIFREVKIVSKKISELEFMPEKSFQVDIFKDVADKTGVSMDKLKKYLIGNEQDTKEWAESLKKSYDKAISDQTILTANFEAYSKAQETGIGVGVVPFVTKEDIDNANSLATALKMIMDAFAAMFKEQNKGGGQNTAITRMKNYIQALTDAYKKFEELKQYKGAGEALIDVKKLFPDLKLPADFNLDYIIKQLEDKLAELPKQFKGKQLIDMQRMLEQSIVNLKFDKLKSDLQKNIEKLSDDISRAQTSKNFFDKMLGLTGDRELAMTLTMSVYGDMGEGIASKIQEQLKTAFGSIDISSYFKGEKIDYLGLEGYATTLGDKLPEKSKDIIDKIVNEGLSGNAKILDDLYSTLGKFQDYESKRTQILRTAAEQRAAIEAQITDEAQKERLNKFSDEQKKKSIKQLEYEEFKDSGIYVKMFDDLDKSSTKSLINMRDKLLQMREGWKLLEPNQVKELQSRLNELNDKITDRNPFKRLSESIKEYVKELKKGTQAERDAALTEAIGKEADAKSKVDTQAEALIIAEKELSIAKEKYGVDSIEYAMALNKVGALKSILTGYNDIYEKAQLVTTEAGNNSDKLRELGVNIQSAIVGIDSYAQQIFEIGDGIKDMMSSFGASDEQQQYFDDILNGLKKVYDGAKEVVMGVAQIMTGDVVGGIFNVVKGIPKLITGFVDLFYAGRIKRANEEIKRQQELLDRLDYTYGKLEKAAESALGTDYIQNYNSQLQNLEAQQQAYLKQAEAERSKGKKADEDKIKEYENAARDTADQIKDMQGQIAEAFTGTDVTSAAKDFARAWLDAYKQFGNTADAMSGKFKDMINDMIVNSILAQMMQKELQPIFDMIDKMSPEEVNDPNFWKKISERAKEAGINMNIGATNLISGLENAGVDIKDITSELTGITKSIAGMTEETALGLAAAFNTQTFYLSDMRLDLKAIRMVIEGQGLTAKVPDYITLQNNYLSTLPRIEANTANTAVQCSRAADACERAVSEVQGLMKIRGGEGARAVPVRIVS